MTEAKVGSSNSHQWDLRGEFHFILLPSTKFLRANDNTPGEIQSNL